MRVTHDSLDDRANSMVEEFARGDLQSITRFYEFPAAVYFGDRMILLRSEADFLRALGAYRAILLRHDLKRVETRVVISHGDAQHRVGLISVGLHTHLQDAMLVIAVVVAQFGEDVVGERFAG